MVEFRRSALPVEVIVGVLQLDDHFLAAVFASLADALLQEPGGIALRSLHADANRLAALGRQRDQCRQHDEKKPLSEHSYHRLLVYVGTNLRLSEQTSKTNADFIL